MKREYNIQISSPMGMKKGKVLLKDGSNGKVEGKLVCLGKECSLKVKLINEGEVEIYGVMEIPAIEDRLEVTGATNQGKLRGVVIKGSENYEFFEAT